VRVYSKIFKNCIEPELFTEENDEISIGYISGLIDAEATSTP